MIQKKASRPRQKKKRSNRTSNPLFIHILWGVLFFTVLFGVLFGVYKVTRIPSLHITEVVVSGGQTVPYDIVRKSAEEALAGTYYRLIPKRFWLLYPEDMIRDKVSQVPRVEQVTLLQEEQTLYIAIDEHEPAALACRGMEGRQCFFLEDSGVAFAPAPNLKGKTFLRIITGNELQRGSEAVSKDALRDWKQIKEALDALGWTVTAVVPEQETVRVIFFGGAYLETLRSDMPEAVLFRAKSIIESEQFSHLTPENTEYIDVRYGNKVFVKEVTEEPEPAETAGVTASSTDEVTDEADTPAIEAAPPAADETVAEEEVVESEEE